MDEVELAGAGNELAGRSSREGERLREGTGQELAELEHVLARLQLPDAGQPTGIQVVEGVQAGKPGEPHPLVEHGVGLSREHLDGVAEVDEGLGEVAGVHALAADVGLAPVREVGDLQRVVGSEPGRWHPEEATGVM